MTPEESFKGQAHQTPTAIRNKPYRHKNHKVEGKLTLVTTVTWVRQQQQVKTMT